MGTAFYDVVGSRLVHRKRWPLAKKSIRAVKPLTKPSERLIAVGAASSTIAVAHTGNLQAMSMKILNGPPDHIVSVQHVPPSKVSLLFADGYFGLWSFQDLELDPANLNLSTIRVAASGTAIEAKSRFGDTVQIDSSYLRAMVDHVYADVLEKVIIALRGPIEDLKTNSVSLPRK